MQLSALGTPAASEPSHPTGAKGPGRAATNPLLEGSFLSIHFPKRPACLPGSGPEVFLPEQKPRGKVSGFPVRIPAAEKVPRGRRGPRVLWHQPEATLLASGRQALGSSSLALGRQLPRAQRCWDCSGRFCPRQRPPASRGPGAQETGLTRLRNQLKNCT